MTDEEKKWFKDEFAGTEVRLIKELVGIELRFKEELAAIEGRSIKLLKEEIAASEARSLEQMRSIETTLLTEFHKWARPAEMRHHGQNAKLRAFEIDLEYLGERVTELERPK